MPVAARPNRKAQGEGALDSRLVEFIDKGGGTPADKSSRQKEPRKKAVHLLDFHDPELMDRVDQATKKPVKRSRNQWLLEAVHEKLERDGQR